MNFNDQAKTWDTDPQKIERAGAFAYEVDHFLEGQKFDDALEFGCGTGLLSFFFRERFRRITLTDTSEGMLEVLREKIRRHQLDHFRPMKIDLLKEDLNEKFDIIYTLMTIHHIDDLDLLFHKFSNLLVDGGYLCIGDLEKEDGSFHSHLSDFDGHNGFERKKLEKLLSLHGFETELFRDFYNIEKKSGEKIRTYPIFILITKKHQ